MNIFKEYVKGDIKNNRKSYNSTRITIFLAIVILSTFLFAVVSYFKSNIDKIVESTGGYHFRIFDGISSKDANDLVLNRHIKKVGFVGIMEIEEGFGSKEKTKLTKMDGNALDTIKSSIKEGDLPKDGEVMISNQMDKEIERTVGDHIEIEDNTYYISGIYYDENYYAKAEDEKIYNIYLNVDQDTLLNSKEELAPFIWYKNMYRTYDLSEKIMDSLESKDFIYGYNDSYLSGSFVINLEMALMGYYNNHFLIITLFIILLILFYSIITNLFLVQESKSIREYSKLKSIGARSRDIDKIIKLKAIYVSQIPIILGIIFSLGLVKVLFIIINGVEKYFSGGKDIYISLKLAMDFKFVLFLYLVSFLIIYLSTRKPIKKLKRNSILDGLKGDVKGKSYKKYDLKYSGNIEKNLSKQFYKNSKYDFRFTGITLKIGFLLMVFIMIGITYYSMDGKYNRLNKYESYDIQCEYETSSLVNEEFIKEINDLEIEELVSFREEIVFLELDDSIVYDEYRNQGSLSNLEKEIYFDNHIMVKIFGIEDEKFEELALERGFNPDHYNGNRAILLNTIGAEFNLPLSRIEDVKFLKDDINQLDFSESTYSMDSTATRGYGFTLNVEDKIDTPLFDYPIIKNGLNLYMPKSQYREIVGGFLTMADFDQYEYLSVKAENTEKIKERIKNISVEYFKGHNYSIKSKLDKEMSAKKANIIGSVLSIFVSIFFVAVGFSNSYFSFYNLFLKRKDELLLYKAIGMDRNLLQGILNRERKDILFSFIFSMPFIILAVAYLISKIFKIFRPIEFILNLNYLFVLVIMGYILIIYIAISKMYNNHTKEL